MIWIFDSLFFSKNKKKSFLDYTKADVIVVWLKNNVQCGIEWKRKILHKWKKRPEWGKNSIFSSSFEAKKFRPMGTKIRRRLNSCDARIIGCHLRSEKIEKVKKIERKKSILMNSFGPIFSMISIEYSRFRSRQNFGNDFRSISIYFFSAKTLINRKRNWFHRDILVWY